METSREQSGTSDVPMSIEDLGTPPDQRPVSEAAGGPMSAPRRAERPEIVDPHRSTAGPGRRRDGLAGVWDSVAYHVQLAALSVYGSADQSRASDPIERLKRRYGRAPRTD